MPYKSREARRAANRRWYLRHRKPSLRERAARAAELEAKYTNLLGWVVSAQLKSELHGTTVHMPHEAWKRIADAIQEER